MGPALGRDWDRCWAGVPDWLDTELLGLGLDLNGVMLWDTPSARMNCSRNSTLVRPLAIWVQVHTPRQADPIIVMVLWPRQGRRRTQSGAALVRLRGCGVVRTLGNLVRFKVKMFKFREIQVWMRWRKGARRTDWARGEKKQCKHVS